jgi:hypothetical protein
MIGVLFKLAQAVFIRTKALPWWVVREMLSKMVDEELTRLCSTIDRNSNRINTLAKEKGVEVLSVKVGNLN